MAEEDATALCDAISNNDLDKVTELLENGDDANGVKPGGGESDTPLKTVIFCLSDGLEETQQESYAEIARLLLQYGADPNPAMELAESRYGSYSNDTCKWEAWHVVAAALFWSYCPPLHLRTEYVLRSMYMMYVKITKSKWRRIQSTDKKHNEQHSYYGEAYRKGVGVKYLS